MSNQNILLISGKSATGKTASLRNIKDHPGVMYLNCEANKALPFVNNFSSYTITDPMQVYEAFSFAEKKDNIHTIVVDSLTFLMDMHESIYVLASKDGRSAWSTYAQYFKKLMQTYVALSSKNVIFFAHTSDVYNESELVMETIVKVKGALMNQGIESYFNIVMSTKKVGINKIGDYANPLLTVSDEELSIGYKYVYQTKLTKDTVNERIRSPMGLFSTVETFIDNDAQHVIDRINTYYGNP